MLYYSYSILVIVNLKFNLKFIILLIFLKGDGIYLPRIQKRNDEMS